MKGRFVWIILAFLATIACQPKANQESEAAPVELDVKFFYQDITGIGKDSIYNRRDHSDLIKVGDTYYVWYTRVDSPVTAGYWGAIWYATSEDEKRYPEQFFFGVLPAWEAYIRHAKNITFKNVTMTTRNPDMRKEIVLDDVEGFVKQ